MYTLRSFFFSSRRRHTRCGRDWSSDVCSSDLHGLQVGFGSHTGFTQTRKVLGRCGQLFDAFAELLNGGNLQMTTLNKGSQLAAAATTASTAFAGFKTNQLGINQTPVGHFMWRLKGRKEKY